MKKLSKDVITMPDNLWYCPAINEQIDQGLCWEYCFAEIGAPTDTSYWLNSWIKNTNKYKNVEDFHKVCEKCIHCQWSTMEVNYQKESKKSEG